MKTKHADDPKKLAGEKHGEEIVTLMEKIVDLEKVDKFNMLVFLNDPFTSNVLAAMLFGKIHCVDVSTGVPQFDLEKFNRLNKKDKLRDIEGLCESIAGIISSIDQVRDRLYQFLHKLVEIEEDLKVKKKG